MTLTLHSTPQAAEPAAEPASPAPEIPEAGQVTARAQAVSGVLDITGGQAVLRLENFLPGPRDPQVPPAQVRRHGLRPGDLVEGELAARPPGERRGAPRLARVTAVNGQDPATAAARPHFADLVPLHPDERLRLETGRNQLVTRVVDLLAPLGKGQRGLIVAPPKTGKTTVLREIAAGIAHNHPECHLMLLLLDERPEEVTDLARSVPAEVVASHFDRPAHDHTAVATLAVERAKRLVELGRDVVVLLDSLTRLCRAYNQSGRASGRVLTGGIDAAALHPPKRLFGAARNIEGGGSLTILASALVDTGSRADDFYFEELKSTGNMELRLDRVLAERRVFPAFDPASSGTRREELLTTPAESALLHRLRRSLSEREPRQAAELLLDRLRATGSNAEFLRRIALTAPEG
ncbi:transcription termination factor Rho [Streptomyces hoynatensis]|uniref:Transcription termination factor Rho n=1 Tax=Streptomyces hoynatensis TaxID=1141874 RepID=A0A3A9YZW8_9ACTN|nr:transcription termination factor Rho [Streptomyces hoynatensis]RKN41279.1 transcription termination factor Rho [Streptomyces hoynatensis]